MKLLYVIGSVISVISTSYIILILNSNIFNNNSMICIGNGKCDTSVKKLESKNIQNLANYQLECRKENDDTNEYILVISIGEKTRSLLVITTGIPFWGERYDEKSRCEEIKTKMTVGIERGADGLSSAYKNGFPVICSSLRGRCLKDANEEIMEIATFRKGVDPKKVAKKLTKKFSGSASAYDDLVTF
jgi:Circadian oscillating protein COP23